MPEIEPADPEARRRALFWLAGGFALGLVAIVGAERYRGAFEEWALLVLVTAGFSFFWSRLAASLTESLR